jgi:hypothetical protein
LNLQLLEPLEFAILDANRPPSPPPATPQTPDTPNTPESPAVAEEEEEEEAEPLGLYLKQPRSVPKPIKRAARKRCKTISAIVQQIREFRKLKQKAKEPLVNFNATYTLHSRLELAEKLQPGFAAKMDLQNQGVRDAERVAKQIIGKVKAGKRVVSAKKKPKKMDNSESECASDDDSDDGEWSGI